MADQTNSTTSTQGQTGTATLEPEHHQTQAATGSPQAGTAPGGQTSTAATTAATSTPGFTPTPNNTPPQGSSTGGQGSPWSPGSTSNAGSTGSMGSSGLSRQESSFPSQGSLGLLSPFHLIDRFFDDFLGYGGFGRGRSSGLSSLFRDLGQGTGQGLWQPQVEVREREGQLVVCADLPGARKEDVHVEIRDDALILQGERNQESEQNQGGYYRSERSYGRFQRVIPLPEGVNPEQAQANFKDGVLEITIPLPQRQSSQGRKIEIT